MSATEAVATEFVASERVRRIRESPSSAAANRVRELRAEGRRIVDFTVGEPDFDTPQHIKDAAVAAIAGGETKYTPVNGTPALREAVRARMLRSSGVRYEDAQITVGGGGKQILYLTFAATLDAGSEVIIPAPYWVSYPDMVLANDGTPVIIQTSAESGYKLTPETLRSAITPRTRWVVINAPGNPTGAVYGREEIAALAAVLEEFPHVWVLTDEIYDEILFTGVGGFDEAFVAYGNEDYDLGMRLVQRGADMRFEPRAVAEQIYDKTFTAWLRDVRSVGRADVFLAGKHPAISPALRLSGRETHPLKRLARRSGMSSFDWSAWAWTALAFTLSVAERLSLRGALLGQRARGQEQGGDEQHVRFHVHGLIPSIIF